MTVFDVEIDSLTGEPADLARYRGNALLIVNVASKCGSTPQYTALESLAEEFADRGLVVLGAPCNQFGGQEPGTAAEIAEFCATTYGVTFPLTEKIDVNGPARHPLFAQLVDTPDTDGEAGDVRWNFEKFIVTADGTPTARFRTAVQPNSPDLREALEKALPH